MFLYNVFINIMEVIDAEFDKVLTADEATYMLALLKDHLAYYGALAENHKCTPANRQRYELVRGLVEKLK